MPYYEPVRGSRITPSGLNVNGTLEVPTEWSCYRCGQTVSNRGGHLVQNAPCRDCREYLRKEEGDPTCWNKRTIEKREAAARAAADRGEVMLELEVA